MYASKGARMDRGQRNPFHGLVDSISEWNRMREVGTGRIGSDELGSVVRLAKPDLAIAGKSQPDGEAQKEARHEHVQPAEIVRDPTHHRRKRAAKGVGEEHAGQDKYRRDGDRDVEHRPKLLYLLSLGPRCLSLLL
jgi:hypothetical protein